MKSFGLFDELYSRIFSFFMLIFSQAIIDLLVLSGLQSKKRGKDMSQSPEALVSCTNCNSDLPPEFGQDIAGKVCPSCGSPKLRLHLNFHDTLEVKVHSNMNAKVKDPRLPSKKNPRVHIFTGDDLRKSDGKWMKKDRVIDKEKNMYTEKVVDPETGEVVHHCDEPLTDHYGHGSAKPKSDK